MQGIECRWRSNGCHSLKRYVFDLHTRSMQYGKPRMLHDFYIIFGMIDNGIMKVFSMHGTRYFLNYECKARLCKHFLTTPLGFSNKISPFRFHQ